MLVRRGWGSFWRGYLIIAASSCILIFIIGEIPPFKEAIKRLGEQNANYPLIFFIGTPFAAAWMIVALGMKLHLQTLPPLRQLWEGKLRTLYRFHKMIQDLEVRLTEDVSRQIDNPDPIEAFNSGINWSFASLSREVAVFRDVACGGPLNESEDKECLSILKKMEGLQERGRKILAVRGGPSRQEKLEAILPHLDSTLIAISDLATECKAIMKRRGMRAE